MNRKTISLLAATLALPGAVLFAQPVLITGIETDTVADPPGFPPGAAGEWTRFGASFDDMGITTDPAEVDEGNQALFIGANFTPGGAWGMGVDYALPTPITDLSTRSVISFRMKQSDPGAQRVFFRVLENDGDIWESTIQYNPTTDYETYSEDLSTSLSLAVGDGDGVLDLDDLASIGFIILRNGEDALYSTFFVDEIYYDADAPAAGALPLVTNIDPPDFYDNGFPPGAESEWTRFGSALADAGIIEDAGEATNGSFFVQLDAAWINDTNTGFAGLRYVPREDNADWTGYDGVEFDVRTTNAAAGGLIEFYIEEADGDIWISAGQAVTETWETVSLSFPDDLVNIDASGGGVLDLDDIALIGFTFNSGVAATSQSFRMDNIRLTEDDPAPVTPPVLPLVTQMDPPDFTTGGFPPLPGDIGDEGEWTRFGAAYNGIFLVTDSSEATAGDRYLQVSANWEEGGIVGARHTPYDAPADWSAYDQMELDLRVNAAVTGTTVTVAIFEDDGDIWVSPPINPTTTWDRYTVAFSSLTLDGASTGDGDLDADEIILWGVNLLNSNLIGLQDLLVDNVVLSSEPTSVRDWMLLD